MQIILLLPKEETRKNPAKCGVFYCLELWGTPKLTAKQSTKRMSYRTIAIAAALSVLALGSPLITAKADPLADIFFGIGLELYKQGDYQGAITEYTKAIEINPQDASTYFNRGKAKVKLGDYRGSIADFTKSIQIHPENATAYFNRAYSKGQLQDLKGACDDWRKAADLGDEDAAGGIWVFC
jgi:tetratricopeptide (TPR) repeat protein